MAWRGVAWRGRCRSCVQSAIACARSLGRLACSVVCCTAQALGENRTLKHCDLSANRLGDQTIASLLTCCGPNRMRCAAVDSNGTAQGCDGCRTCCMVYVAWCMLYAVCCMLCLRHSTVLMSGRMFVSSAPRGHTVHCRRAILLGTLLYCENAKVQSEYDCRGALRSEL